MKPQTTDVQEHDLVANPWKIRMYVQEHNFYGQCVKDSNNVCPRAQFMATVWKIRSMYVQEHIILILTPYAIASTIQEHNLMTSI